MKIDWKSLLQVAINRLIPIILTAVATFLSTKWEAGAQVLRDLSSGQNVSLWNGTVNLSLVNIQLWVFTGAVALISIATGWLQRSRLKQAANIALQLPKGATKLDVQTVADQSPSLSTQADPLALKDVVNSIQRR